MVKAPVYVITLPAAGGGAIDTEFKLVIKLS